MLKTNYLANNTNTNNNKSVVTCLRQPGDDTKVIVCESCDKCYHSYCLKHDTITNLATDGWRCDSCSKELSLVNLCSTCSYPLLKLDNTCENCLKQRMALTECKKKSALKDPAHSSSSMSNSSDSNDYAKEKKPPIPSKKKQPVSKKANTNRNLKRSNSQLSAQMNGSGRGGASGRGGGGGGGGRNGKEAKAARNPSNKDSENSSLDGVDAYSDEPTIGQIKRDDENHHAVTIIASLDDSFILKHDMCLSCGSFGRPEEDPTLACSQCGQCFHNYCSGISNMNNVMRERGWRCLDCTVCEGCGTATDESRLLLCDDCDISYHIYCLSPPLAHVPKGNWKCKWCVKCVKCGGRTPGSKKMEWKNNYTECALCNSTTVCHVCDCQYKEADLIGKCSGCDRWSHLNCQHAMNEEEAEKQFGQTFCCIHCQEEKSELTKKAKKNSENTIGTQNDSLQFLEELASLSKRGYLDEGTFLTEVGTDLIKKLKVKPAPNSKRRARPANVSSEIETNQR